MRATGKREREYIKRLETSNELQGVICKKIDLLSAFHPEDEVAVSPKHQSIFNGVHGIIIYRRQKS
jgi:hypothetical protein